ncbi:MAG TPA: CHAP domain-containing protein [Acidimicrobiales bacterium]|nr:CHAP domain-containing protein [Acidimicrobiales bacterium]
MRVRELLELGDAGSRQAPTAPRAGPRPGYGAPPGRQRPGQRQSPRAQWRRRRRVAALAVLAIIGAAVLGGLEVRSLRGGGGGATVLRPPGGRPVAVPAVGNLPALRARIVQLAESQLGYRTDPPSTYCNKYSAYWASGAATCGPGELSEEWCADFAAWVWQKAGVPVNYQYKNGFINSSAASFYEWAREHGTWYPVGSGYVPRPGDVAVYGLNPAALVASHVAVVIGYQRGQRGPIAINGDGDLTGFSAVEVQTDEYFGDTQHHSAPLSGYVSPT